MNYINKTIIDAIIKKAEALCPDSLALIGIYGSVAAGDEHKKSDLDLTVLINDKNGQILADGFILDDIDVGYDIYCTSWDMLERDAQYNHAYLSKLFDSMIVYCKDKNALKRAETVEKIRSKLTELLVLTDEYLKATRQKELPAASALYGTYEEMYSNWKNKMAEAADRDDMYSSFMNLVSLQDMLYETAEGIKIDDFEIMDKFDPQDLENN